MDVNEHERLSNITLKTQIKLKKQCSYCHIEAAISNKGYDGKCKKDIWM